MGQVQLRFTVRAVEVVVWGEPLYEARTPDEACRVADWARFHLRRGASLAELRAGLAGAPMEYAGDGVLLADSQACRGALKLAPTELARALASGALDDSIGALLEAERLGRARPEILRVLGARRRWLAERTPQEDGWTSASSST